MSEKIKTYKGKVKKKGNFPFSDFYKFLYDYLIDEGYNVYETTYLEKRQGDSKELNITWQAYKQISNYFQFEIDSNWIILGMKSIEYADPDDATQKIKTDNGALEIGLSSTLIKDPNNQWTKKFWKYLRKIYDKYVIRKRIDQYEEELIEETNKYAAYMRSLLEMQGQHSIRRETLA